MTAIDRSIALSEDEMESFRTQGVSRTIYPVQSRGNGGYAHGYRGSVSQ